MAWERVRDETGKALANRSMINTETGEIISRREYREREQLGGQRLEQNAEDRRRYEALTGERAPRNWTPDREGKETHKDEIPHLETFTVQEYGIPFDLWEELPFYGTYGPAAAYIESQVPEQDEIMIVCYGLIRPETDSDGGIRKWLTTVDLTAKPAMPDDWNLGMFLSIEILSVAHRPLGASKQ